MTENLFAALPPVPESLVIGGETLDITPLKVGELPIFARTVRPIAGKLGPDPDWLRLLSEDGESVILALAIACRRPPEWVSGLALDDAIRSARLILSWPKSSKNGGASSESHSAASSSRLVSRSLSIPACRALDNAL